LNIVEFISNVILSFNLLPLIFYFNLSHVEKTEKTAEQQFDGESAVQQSASDTFEIETVELYTFIQ